MEFVKGRKYKDVLLAAVEATGIKQTIQKELEQSIEDKLMSPERMLCAMAMCDLSERKFQLVVHILHSNFDEELDKYAPEEIAPGVNGPKLASVRQVLKKRAEVFEKLGPVQSADGDQVTLGLAEALNTMINDKWDSLKEVTDVLVCGDGAGFARGVSQCTFAIKVTNSNGEMREFENGRSQTRTLLCYEGPETYLAVKAALEERLDPEARKILNDEGILQVVEGEEG